MGCMSSHEQKPHSGSGKLAAPTEWDDRRKNRGLFTRELSSTVCFLQGLLFLVLDGSAYVDKVSKKTRFTVIGMRGIR